MGWWTDFKASANTKLARFNNRTFKDGAMATCALIAAADGTVDESEKKKVVALIAANEALQLFGAEELGNLFKGYCAKAADEFARLDLINTVRKLKSDPAAADTCLKVALIVANADGDFAESEKKVVRELCAALGLPSENYLTA